MVNPGIQAGPDRGGLWDRLRSLSVSIDRYEFSTREVVAGGQRFDRTIVRAFGDGHVGVGEDVTPDSTVGDSHDRFETRLPTGSHTIEAASPALGAALSRLDDDDEQSGSIGAYRRWGFESAVLDLALKQAGESLADRLDRSFDPVGFVASLDLGESPRVQPVRDRLEAVPDLGFKIDVPPDPSETFLQALAETDAVEILDCKGQYERDIGPAADPELYRTLFTLFPEAILEDPIITEETIGVLESRADRVSWDAPITDVESVRNLAIDPAVLNIKPCRFGTVASLCRVLEHAFERNIELYGGGMFEVSAGRAHSQALASLLYPDGPNDLAPPAYHDFEAGDSLPTSPIEPPAEPVGIGWHVGEDHSR
jgi:L-alanine-DL-glutamate epimerase-like enolase superfamily enzyme